MSEAEIVEVYLAADDSEAYFVKNLLEDAGIKAQVVNDMLVLPPGETMSPRVWVSHADEARAREIILKWEDERDEQHTEPEKAPWKCPACGEDVEADFEVCWNCERPRDGAPGSP